VSHDLDVIAQVDSDASRLSLASTVPPEAKFTSLGAALDAVEAEAVLITARIEAHHVLAKEALLAGKHVLLEKPFTVTVADAEELNALAAQRGLVLCVAQNYRFWPVVATVSALLEQSAVGELRNVRLSFRRDHGGYPPSLSAPAGSATGSVLYQISVHHFDLVRAVLGEIMSVDARRWTNGNLSGRLTAFSATLELESGLLVEYSADQVSHASETPWSGLWEMEGSRGLLRWAGNATTTADEAFVELITDESDRVHIPIEQTALSDRQAVVAEFADVIRQGRPSAISGSENIKTLEAVLRTAESIETHDR
jgi:predicted dehydrogenase